MNITKEEDLKKRLKMKSLLKMKNLEEAYYKE